MKHHVLSFTGGLSAPSILDSVSNLNYTDLSGNIEILSFLLFSIIIGLTVAVLLELLRLIFKLCIDNIKKMFRR